ncbi:hypothetical protein GNF10_13670 [Nostoc sp. UCD121]|uniref:hypothetical protein n=1 Tax=unclassified Nostoc TaxID=2593658 RepID=UPI001626C517|nr:MULTISPECIES: hypothetical protein [unclassified Nostoc]MBC1223004.1 hypothetical protein [Nostoc sp. UCD120]MBC1276989.1 hypothetical protein [Nostoc sp. UCD121]MBC1298474.1 hypothetical protein [Nostoc sp. UCD122]
MSTTGYAYIKKPGNNTDGLVKSGRAVLMIIEIYSSQDQISYLKICKTAATEFAVIQPTKID